MFMKSLYHIYQMRYKKNWWQGICSAMVITIVNELGYLSSNPEQGVCKSLSTNTLGKDMNTIILPPPTGK